MDFLAGMDNDTGRIIGPQEQTTPADRGRSRTETPRARPDTRRALPVHDLPRREHRRAKQNRQGNQPKHGAVHRRLMEAARHVPDRDRGRRRRGSRMERRDIRIRGGTKRNPSAYRRRPVGGGGADDGHAAYPWQRYVADVACEIDPRHRQLLYDTVVVSTRVSVASRRWWTVPTRTTRVLAVAGASPTRHRRERTPKTTSRNTPRL